MVGTLKDSIGSSEQVEKTKETIVESSICKQQLHKGKMVPEREVDNTKHDIRPEFIAREIGISFDEST